MSSSSRPRGSTQQMALRFDMAREVIVGEAIIGVQVHKDVPNVRLSVPCQVSQIWIGGQSVERLSKDETPEFELWRRQKPSEYGDVLEYFERFKEVTYQRSSSGSGHVEVNLQHLQFKEDGFSDKVSIKIAFTVYPTPASHTGFFVKGKLDKRDDYSVFFLSQMSSGPGWFPRLEGDPVVHWKYTILVDEGYTAVGTGLLTRESSDSGFSRFEYESRMAIRGSQIGICVGKFISHQVIIDRKHALSDDVKTATMNVYAPPGYEECLGPSTRWVEIALPIIEKRLDTPMPFASLNFLFAPLLMHSSAAGSEALFGNFFMLDLEDLCNMNQLEATHRSVDSLLKCLTSTWFGTYLMPEHPSDNWILSGVRTWLTDAFIMHWFGQNEVMYRRLELQERYLEMVRKGLDWRPLAPDPEGETAMGWPNTGMWDVTTDRVFKAKAPLVVTALSQQIGTPAFQAVLGHFLENAKTAKDVTGLSVRKRNLSTGKFIKQVEKRFSPSSTDHSLFMWFVRQFIHGTGVPLLHIGMQYNTKANRLDICLQQRPLNPPSAVLNYPYWSTDGKLFEEFRKSCDCGIDPECLTNVESGVAYGFSQDSWGHPIPLPTESPEKYWTGKMHISINTTELSTLKFEFSSSQYMTESITLPRLKQKKVTAGSDDEKSNKVSSDLPGYVVADPDFHWLLAKLHVCQSAAMWITQLLESNSVVAEWRALEALQHIPAPEVAKALQTFVEDESRHYGVRARAVRSLVHMHNKGLTTNTGLVIANDFIERLCFDSDQGGDPKVKPNDWTDISQCFLIQKVLKEFSQGKGEIPADFGQRVVTPAGSSNEARMNSRVIQLLMKLLIESRNDDNEWSDVDYMTTLIECLGQVTLEHVSNFPQLACRLEECLSMAKNRDLAMPSLHHKIEQAIFRIAGKFPQIRKKLEMVFDTRRCLQRGLRRSIAEGMCWEEMYANTVKFGTTDGIDALFQTIVTQSESVFGFKYPNTWTPKMHDIETILFKFEILYDWTLKATEIKSVMPNYPMRVYKIMTLLSSMLRSASESLSLVIRDTMRANSGFYHNYEEHRPGMRILHNSYNAGMSIAKRTPIIKIKTSEPVEVKHTREPLPFVITDGPNEEMSSIWKRGMDIILERLLEMHEGSQFADSVKLQFQRQQDWKEYLQEIGDYNADGKFSATPMDLSQVKQNLETYGLVSEFHRDMQQVFANCCRYNKSRNHEIYNNGLAVLSKYQDLWSKLEHRMKTLKQPRGGSNVGAPSASGVSGTGTGARIPKLTIKKP